MHTNGKYFFIRLCLPVYFVACIDFCDNRTNRRGAKAQRKYR